jgi:hypothetical protein
MAATAERGGEEATDATGPENREIVHCRKGSHSRVGP